MKYFGVLNSSTYATPPHQHACWGLVGYASPALNACSALRAVIHYHSEQTMLLAGSAVTTLTLSGQLTIEEVNKAILRLPTVIERRLKAKGDT